MDEGSDHVALGPGRATGMAGVQSSRGVSAFGRGQEPPRQELLRRRHSRSLPAPAGCRGSDSGFHLSKASLAFSPACFSLSSQPISGPPSLSVVVLASADGASHGSEDPEDHANHQKYAADGHQHGDSRDESHDQKHHSENDHLRFHFSLGGRPFLHEPVTRATHPTRIPSMPAKSEE